MSAATVSVVIPARNMGAFIVQAVESALSQTLQPHEVIVVDDASTDDTVDLLRKYGSAVRLLRGPGRGSAIARNLGILAATGDYVAFLDADDLWYPAKLERQVADLQFKEAIFGYTDFVSGADPGTTGMRMLDNFPEAPEGMVFEKLLVRNFVLTSSVLVQRSALARSGLFRPALTGGQDVDLWLRLARFARVACTREVLVFYRRHGENITAQAKYSMFHARRWEWVYREHADVAPALRKYMRKRWAQALFAAGRQAWWRHDYAAARRCFVESLQTGHVTPGAIGWLCVCSVPVPVLQALRRSKRTRVPAGPDA